MKPFHKGGSKHLASNYRPVCLTSVCCKLLERIVKEGIQQHLDQNNLVQPAQHGFIPGRSCLTSLMLTREEWVQAKDEHRKVHVVLFDFSKAFDKVDHHILLHRLEQIGIGGTLLQWINDFLANRKWAVRVNGVLSDWRAAPSGVPQGSVLGPLLFIIFVSTLPADIRARSIMFADDLKIWCIVENREDEDCLQSSIDAVISWATCNNMQLNPSKTLHIVVGASNGNDHSQYTIAGKPITSVPYTRDLGIMISSDLKTRQNTKHKVGSSLRLLWALRRGFQYWSKRTATIALKIFIRPIMEYAGQATFPCTKEEMAQLERVQRIATRMVPELRYLDYDQRCIELNLFSIAYRRVRGDMILLYRILRLGQCPTLRPLFQLADRSVLRGHSLHLVVPRTNNVPHQYRFSTRVVRLWNSLPEDIVSATCIGQFKTRLDQFLWNQRENLQERHLHQPGYPAGW